jgi:hypothetical protein
MPRGHISKDASSSSPDKSRCKSMSNSTDGEGSVSGRWKGSGLDGSKETQAEELTRGGTWNLEEGSINGSPGATGLLGNIFSVSLLTLLGTDPTCARGESSFKLMLSPVRLAHLLCPSFKVSACRCL